MHYVWFVIVVHHYIFLNLHHFKVFHFLLYFIVLVGQFVHVLHHDWFVAITHYCILKNFHHFRVFLFLFGSCMVCFIIILNYKDSSICAHLTSHSVCNCHMLHFFKTFIVLRFLFSFFFLALFMIFLPTLWLQTSCLKTLCSGWMQGMVAHFWCHNGVFC
jgi:hypothetical protein